MKKLNDQDLLILKLTCEGLTSKEIADTIHLSFRTIEDRRSKLYNYFRVKNKAELISYTFRQGVLDEV